MSSIVYNDGSMETPTEHVNDTLSSEELKQIYHTRFAEKLGYREKVWEVLLRDYFQKWFGKDDTVLDLGAGYGEFIQAVVCGKKYAMDLNPDTKGKVGKDVTVFEQDCSKPWPLPDNSLDAVFTSNFFEHLPDKLALTRTISEVTRCLKPGGRIVAMGPNIKYLPGKYWDFIDHYLPLTELSLSEALTQGGLSTETCIDKFMPFTMVNAPEYPPVFISLYLKLPLAWRIFGKQFVVVASKPI